MMMARGGDPALLPVPEDVGVGVVVCMGQTCVWSAKSGL